MFERSQWKPNFRLFLNYCTIYPKFTTNSFFTYILRLKWFRIFDTNRFRDIASVLNGEVWMNAEHLVLLSVDHEFALVHRLRLI